MNYDYIKSYLLLIEQNIATQQRYQKMYNDPDHTTSSELTDCRTLLSEQVAQLKRCSQNPEITFFVKGKI